MSQGTEHSANFLEPDISTESKEFVEWALIGEQNLHSWAEYLLEESSNLSVKGWDPENEQVFRPETDNVEEYGHMSSVKFDLDDLHLLAGNAYVDSWFPFKSGSLTHRMTLKADGFDLEKFTEFAERENRQRNRRKLKRIEDRWDSYSNGILSRTVARFAKKYQKFQVVGQNKFHAKNRRKSLSYGVSPEELADIYENVNEINL